MSNDFRDDDHFRDDDDSAALPAQLRDPIGVLKRQHRSILTIFVLSAIVVAAVTALAPLRYKASASIMLTAKSIPDEFVPTTIIASIAEQFGTIRGEVFSRDHLSSIITETGAYAKAHNNTTRASLVERLRNDLIIEPLGSSRRSRGSQTSISFELSMKGQDPAMLANVVNVTVAHLIDENVKYRSRQARLTTQFMRREYERADIALREHQRKLAEFRLQNRGALPDDRTAALSRLDRLEEQRRSAILRQNDFRARLEHLEARPQSAGSDNELDILRAQLRQAKSLYTDDHPSVVSLKRQVEAMESGGAGDKLPVDIRRSDERTVLIDGARSEQQRLSQIDEDVASLEGLLARAPEIAEEYAALTRLESILQENYVEYLRKVKSAELALSLESAQQGAQLTRIDSAVVPTAPIIARWLIGAAGIVAALGLAILVAIVRELLNPVIIDEQHMQDALPIPLLGSIAKIA